MNIIELTEYISLEKSNIGKLTKEDFPKIKAELIAEKEANTKIDEAHISDLLKALKMHPEELKAIMNNRILFNFFAKTDYPRAYFTYDESIPETEKVKSFIQNFLIEELNVAFNQDFDTNKFELISSLADASNYFPDALNFSLRQHGLDKLDEAITALKPPYGNFSKIMYIKDANFFAFLNRIKDEEVEARVETFFNTVKSFYNQNNGSELASNVFSALNKYTPTDTAFAEKIKNYKDIGDTNVGKYTPKKKNLTWVYIVVGLVIFIRILIFISANNFNNGNYSNDGATYEDETETSSEPPKIDRYYTDMKFQIDSFQTFLTNFKESEIKQLTRETSLKTGENPFETFYENPPTPDSNNFITVKNRTGYDMVLLENTVMYDSIKIPRTAHFIKAGDALEINFNSGYTDTVFNIYLGKEWATFQTDKNLFIRNGSIVEYRFSELIPDSKSILRTDYNFINDAEISYSKGGLDIDSPGARVNPLKSSTEE